MGQITSESEEDRVPDRSDVHHNYISAVESVGADRLPCYEKIN